MRKYFNQVHSFQRRRSARWKFARCLNMVFSRQSSIGACQNLEDCVAFPRKPPKRMHRRCFSNFVRMLWHHRRTWFGDCLDRGLCAWQFAYSGLIAQALASNEPSRSPWTSGDCIRSDIAWKNTDGQGYTKHPTILKFLAEITTMPAPANDFFF